MGSIATLQLGRLEVAWSKNEFFSSHGGLFQANDLMSVPRDGFEDEEETPLAEQYSKPLRLVRDRLELMGYTLSHAREEFENPSPFADNPPLKLLFDEVLNILKTVNVARVTNEFSEQPVEGVFAPSEIRALIRSSRHLDSFTFDHWDLLALLENFSPYSMLRVLAESPSNIELPVTWDFDEVVRNGWVNRNDVTHGLEPAGQFLIVTEGSSDAKILQKALTLLRPHIADFFRFVDMDEGYPFTGTGNLYNFVKGLISIGIQNHVIVVFDNDAEGVFNMNRCRDLNVPGNMKIVKLPDLEEFQAFQTIGPNGRHLADINSSGAAIECYLDVGGNPLVRWTNYNEGRDSYQGSLVDKDRYKRAFLQQRQKKAGYNYHKIEQVLNLLTAECIAMREVDIRPKPTSYDDTDEDALGSTE